MPRIVPDRWSGAMMFAAEVIGWRAAHRALSRGDTARVLTVVLDRLYTLRNQLIHGGATWNSSVNRDQVRDATRIMERIVPAIIHILMANPNEKWGTPSYPVVE